MTFFFLIVSIFKCSRITLFCKWVNINKYYNMPWILFLKTQQLTFLETDNYGREDMFCSVVNFIRDLKHPEYFVTLYKETKGM